MENFLGSTERVFEPVELSDAEIAAVTGGLLDNSFNNFGNITVWNNVSGTNSRIYNSFILTKALISL